MSEVTEKIRKYLQQHEQIIRPLQKDYCEKLWELSLTGDEKHEKELVESKARYLHVYNNRDEFRQLQEWKDEAKAMDPLEARQFKLIYDSFVPNQIEPAVLQDIVERETQIENLFNTFRADFEGQKATDNLLRDVLKTDGDLARRQAAWEASKQVGQAVAPQLLELVRIRNREARKLGYSDYYAMMFELQELDQKTVFSLFEKLESLSESGYTEMKRNLDGLLKKRYGIPDAPSFPWLYSDPFFQEYPAAGGGEMLDEIFKDRDIEALTRAHYASIGLNIDDLLSHADLYEKEGKSQHAFCLDVDHEGDVRVLCNVRKNERWMSTMLHEFGHAVYDKFTDHPLPFLLRTPAHILTTEAIAMLNGRMSKDPEWLVRIGGLTQAQADRVSAAAWDVLRSEMLIFLRWAITLVRFERELYRDPEQDLNRLWWEYVARFQQVTPPAGRNVPDWAAKSHLSTSPAYYQNYVLGELMASQLLRFIHKDVVKKTSYVGNPEVGDFLVEKIFKPGARFEWNEMLKRATGEALNPEHFIRHFVNS
jgi:peptidyl-dipeptidase A